MSRLFLLIMCFFVFSSASVWAQKTTYCEDNLEQVKSNYLIGDFRKVIESLGKCIQGNGFRTSDAKAQAYELLALTYIAIDSLEKAEEYIKSIVVLKPNYTQPTDLKNIVFKDIFDRVSQEGVEVRVSSVSKKAEDIDAAPASVLLITRNEIIERGYLDIVDAIQDLPGFDVNKLYSVNYANIFQLGFRQENTEKTLLMVDGVEENDLWLNWAYLSRQYPLSAIKAIEVLYGPSSTMYGPRSFVGAINIITLDPSENPSDPLLKKNKIKKEGNQAVRFSLYGNVLNGGYNTSSADVTMNVKGKPSSNFSMQITGRYYKSDEHTMQGEFYDYQASDIDSLTYNEFTMNNLNWIGGLNKYMTDMKLPLTSPYYRVDTNNLGNISSITLTQEGINRARSLDKLAYTGMVNGAPVGYSNSAEDYYIGMKLKVADFTFGFRHWKLKKGFNFYQDINDAGTNNGAMWAPVNTTVYSNVQKKLGEQSEITNLTTFSIHSLDRESNRVNLMAFGDPSTKLHFAHLLYPDSLFPGKPGLSRETTGIFGTEGYHAERFSMFEHGWRNRFFYYKALQARNELRYFYSSKNKKLDVASGIDLRYTQTQGDYIIYQNFDTKAATVQEFQAKQKDIFLAKEKGISGDQMAGANIYDIFDLGVFGQLSYKITDKLSFVAGTRRDQNTIRNSGGFGAKISPRLALIYQYKNLFNAKAIYSRGIQSVSQWTKYSTGGGRTINPDLKTENIDYVNLELNGQSHADPNKSLFSWNTVGFWYWVNNAVASQTIGTTKINVHSGKYEIKGTMTNIRLKLAPTFIINVNHTFILPYQTESKVDSTKKRIRLGDIASHHLNLGFTGYVEKAGPFRISLNLRGNYVGGRQVGEKTTVKKNLGVDSSRTIPDYLIFNGNIGISAKAFPYLRLDVGVENILNMNILDPERKLYYAAGPRQAEGSFNMPWGVKDAVYSDQNVPFMSQRGRFFRLRFTYNIH
ncbi:MAG: hypothetical protein RJB03_622 [Bacteroidota bacterium]